MAKAKSVEVGCFILPIENIFSLSHEKIEGGKVVGMY